MNYQGYDALLPFMDAEKEGVLPIPQLARRECLSAGCSTLKEGLKKLSARHESAEMCRSGLRPFWHPSLPQSEEACALTVTGGPRAGR